MQKRKINSSTNHKQERKSFCVKSFRESVFGDFKKQRNENKSKKLHNPEIGFFLEVENFPSLKNKISDRFIAFFNKFENKLIFKNQELYKVSLSRLPQVIKSIIKFSCSHILTEEDLGLESPASDVPTQYNQAEIRNENIIEISPIPSPINGGGSPQRKNNKNEESQDPEKFNQNSLTPKRSTIYFRRQSKPVRKSKFSVEPRLQLRLNKSLNYFSSQMPIYEEYTFFLQPLMSFIFSLHRITFFMDLSDKNFLYASIYGQMGEILEVFYECSKIQNHLYGLKEWLIEKADFISDFTGSQSVSTLTDNSSVQAESDIDRLEIINPFKKNYTMNQSEGHQERKRGKRSNSDIRVNTDSIQKQIAQGRNSTLKIRKANTIAVEKKVKFKIHPSHREKKSTVMRKKAKTRDIMSLYNNQGFSALNLPLRRQESFRNTVRFQLLNLSSFPYLISLLVDLETFFIELRHFRETLEKESFFERLGIVNEEKNKNKRRLFRYMLFHHKSLFTFKLNLAKNFLTFTQKMKSVQKHYLLDIIQKYYLCSPDEHFKSKFLLKDSV